MVQHFHLFDWRLAGPRVGQRRLGLKWATAPANCTAAVGSFLALELRLLAVDDSGLSNGGRLARRPSAQDGSYLGGFPPCGSHANQVCGGDGRLKNEPLLDHGRRRGARAPPRSAAPTLALFLRRSTPWVVRDAPTIENDTSVANFSPLITAACRVQTPCNSTLSFLKKIYACEDDTFKIIKDALFSAHTLGTWEIFIYASEPSSLETILKNVSY